MRNKRITIGTGPIILITDVHDKYLEEKPTVIQEKTNEVAKNQHKKREREFAKTDVHQMSKKEEIGIKEIEEAFKTKQKLKLPKGSKLSSLNHDGLRRIMNQFPEGSTERIIGIRMLAKNYRVKKVKP